MMDMHVIILCLIEQACFALEWGRLEGGEGGIEARRGKGGVAIGGGDVEMG